MSKPRKIYSEDKMKELISREGDGEEVPEGSKIFYYPDFIEKGGVMIPNKGPKRKVKSITKVVSGNPRPKKGADPGNIKSKENTNLEFKGDDLDYLRKKRKKMKIKTGKSKPDTVPDFRKAGGISIDYRKRKGGLFS
tara:strand:- start:7 stop:417 length:411 start_codon:yes stop_codon:yes gene_type:complete